MDNYVKDFQKDLTNKKKIWVNAYILGYSQALKDLDKYRLRFNQLDKISLGEKDLFIDAKLWRQIKQKCRYRYRGKVI